MAVTIKLPAALAGLAGKSEIEVQAATVSAAILALDEQYPVLAGRICTERVPLTTSMSL